MEFRILGPLEVLEDGQQLDLGGAKQRALLAMLLLHANEVVSQDRLIEAVWDEQPPETAQKALQVYISRLRKTLGKERLETKARGYLLRVAEGELDLERFQRLADEQPKEALALWRGEPLAEFSYQRFAQTEIARLEELRLACRERRIEKDLEHGRHAAVVGELERLVREHPLRERLRAQLMLALYRSGRQAEALEAYQDARRALTEELGLEPSAELRELQQAILEQRPALELEPTDVPATQPNVVSVAKRSEGTEGRGARLERKTVTVVHVQVAVASGGGGEVDPEVLRHVLGRVSEHVTSVVESHEGSIDTITGNSIGAVFGLPFVHEDDASRALRAADEVRDRLDVLTAELARESTGRLELRIGLSTGEVMTGGAASQPRATGAPLTAAARLAHDAELGTIAADDATRRAAGSRRNARRFVSSMVGRTRERRRMHDAFDQAIGDSSCQLFTVLGAAGVGKSRLVQEFLGDLEEQALVARGRCLPYGEGITYWPVLEAVRDAAELDDSATTEESLAKIAAVLGANDDADLVSQRLGELVGFSDHTSGTEEIFWALRTFFEALASRRPLVLVFDDIHWAEPTFLDLLDHISDWARDAPILLVCVARPELLDVRARWGGGKLNATAILLEPLSEAESMELVGNLTGSLELENRARRGIVEAAEGNPLFVEEMLAYMTEEGSAAVEIPPTIQGLLAARLDRLEERERTAIEAAAVEGKVFHESSVAELVSRPQDEVQESLLALVRKELIRRDRSVFSRERAYRFRHLLIRDAAYESIPKEERAKLHETHAAWLEERAGERTLEFEEILGYHLEQAFRYRSDIGPVDESAGELARQAGIRLGAAGRRALGRGDAPAAVKLLSRAAALLPADDPLRVQVVPGVRMIQGLAEQLHWADDVLEDAMASDDQSLVLHARVQKALLRLFTEETADVDELVAVANEGIRAFETLGDELGQARSWRLLGQARYLERQSAASVDAAEHGLVHARLTDDPVEEGEILAWLGISFYMGAIPAPEAERRVRAHLADVRGSRLGEGLLLGCLAPLVAMQGRLPEAEEIGERAGAIVDELGYFSQQLASIQFHRGVTALLAADNAAAERVLRGSLGPLEAIRDTSNYCAIVAVLARVLYNQGLYPEAEEMTHLSEQTAHLNDVFAHITWRTVRAKALARRGELVEAERLAQEAIAFAAESDFLTAYADALLDLAEIREIAERPADAVPAVETAVDLYQQKGDVVSTERAREQLQRLAAPAPGPV